MVATGFIDYERQINIMLIRKISPRNQELPSHLQFVLLS